MNHLAFYFGNEIVEFGLGTRKFLLGRNAAKKFDMYKTLRQAITKTKNSDYAVDNNHARNVTLNDKDVHPRQMKFFTITYIYDFLEESKLKTQSILYQYLRQVLKNIEYSEEFNTLSLLFSDFSRYVSDQLDMSGEYEMHIEMDDLNIKTLLKMMRVRFNIDEELIVPFDLSYEETILHQLRMVETISRKDVESDYIVWLDLPKLTDGINAKLDEIVGVNLHILIPQEIYCPSDLSEVLLVNDHVYDLADDITLYKNFVLELPNAQDIDDAQRVIRSYLNNERTEETSQLEGIL